jgi:hypothetical protein
VRRGSLTSCLFLYENLGGKEMSTITDLFSTPVLLDYTRNRQETPMLGESLFPSRKIQGLKFEYLKGGNSLPVAAKVHSLDTEAEIGSREASKGAEELALIKRKMQLKEEDIIALGSPRNPQEQQFLMNNVFNDSYNLYMAIRARLERMRMEVLSTGKVTLNENVTGATIDYHVPEDHKGASNWASDDSDPLQDIQDWFDKMDIKPTRALTSTKVLRTLMRNKKVIASVFGNDTGKVLTNAELDQYLGANGLPLIRTYDSKYREQVGQSYTAHRYLDEDKFVMFNEYLLGETVYGTTAEEIRLMSNPGYNSSMMGNIFLTSYEESGDPVSTFIKAAAVALPSFAAADEVFQATIDTTAPTPDDPDDGGKEVEKEQPAEA